MPIDGALRATGIVGISLLAAGEAPNFLSGMMPSLFTIQAFSGDRTEAETSFRRGEALGVGLALLVGVGASLAVSSWLPLLATIGVLVVLVAAYEHAMRNPYAGAGAI